MLRNMLSLLLSKFYSKKDAALVAHQAIPELSQYIDLASSTTTNVENTYVAPTDGYFVCATKGGEGSGVNVWGTLDVGAPGAIGIQGKVFAPCAKGVSVHYIIYGTIHLVRFYKTIGGGYQALKNALLQGGAICLSNLCSSLRRSSLQARRSGYRTSETRIIQKVSPCLCLTKGTISSMSHHVMGCLSWRKAAQARCTLSATAETIGSTLIRNILTPIIKDYLCKLIRAKQYLIKPRPITEAASAVVNSSLLCQDLNKLEGGASC